MIIKENPYFRLIFLTNGHRSLRYIVGRFDIVGGQNPNFQLFPNLTKSRILVAESPFCQDPYEFYFKRCRLTTTVKKVFE